MRALEIDYMGLDPGLVERGEILRLSEVFPAIASIFTWGGTQHPAEVSQNKDRYLREAMQVFVQFCEVMGSLEKQFKTDLAPSDHATPSATQQALSAVNSRGAGLYGIFLRGIIDKMDEAPVERVPKPLVPKYDVFTTRYYKIVQNRTEVYDIVTQVVHKMDGWEELPHGLGLGNVWNLCWTWSKPKLDYSRLCAWQKVNHFPENKHLTRKDCLKRCIDRYIRTGGKMAQYFTICPRTFVLPKEYCLFIECFARIDEENEELTAGGARGARSAVEESLSDAFSGSADGHREKSAKKKAPNLWIMKPAGSSRGRGIQVVNDVSSVQYGELTIIQQYISNPFLLNNYKWDMRVYVMVTSFNPLEAFIYKDGFARFATVPYSNDSEDIGNLFVHLTNSSINRHNEEGFVQGSGGDAGSAEAKARAQDAVLGGTKIAFGSLRQRLRAVGVEWEPFWAKMIECILKSLCMAEDHIPFQVNSFEMFGYDLMLDTRQKMWLIEVNSSPSMGQEHLLDEQVKQPLINDTIRLIDPMPFDRRRLADCLQRRVERKAATGAAGGRQQLDIDLHSVLRGEAPRKFGEMPKHLGNYERIAPSEAYDVVTRNRATLFNNRPAKSS